MKAMTRKAMSLKLPASTSSTASTTNTRLKKVRVFSRMIWPVVLVLEAAGLLVYPAADSSAACAAVRPRSASGWNSGSSGRSSSG